MNTFNLLCGNTDDELAAKAFFGEIKMWFLTQYPEIEKARQNIDEIIAKAKDARRDYPSYQVTLRSIKKKEDKESYRGLTYKYMEDYIRTHANAAANMAEYHQQRLLAECHSIRYPNIKKWFLAMYPEVAQFGVTEIHERKVENTLSIVKGEAALQAA